jgi:hypothetical protein
MGATTLSLLACASGFKTDRWEETRTPKHHQQGQPPKKQPPTGTPPSQGGGITEHEAGGGGSHEESTECARISKQKGITEEVLNELQALYTGQHQLGPVATGCPFEVKEETTPDGTLYWVLGTEAGDLNPKSIAIVSPKFTSMIVLWPAARPVREMIEKHEDVGSGQRHLPRYYAGSGSYYLIASENGTVVLLQELLGTAQKAEAFIAMPASVSFAWLSAVRESGVWQWPEPPGRNGTTFKLKVTTSKLIGFEIAYEPKGKTAIRNTLTRKPASYKAQEPEISPSELRRWAPRIPKEEEELEAEQSHEEGPASN